ncbi:MAG TPA: hypothetical protein VI815_01820 [Candidatus Nanoarchaeia archaeon]|nr:hypothetical protein [Candidatus Nanoarchaeia archaeon]
MQSDVELFEYRSGIYSISQINRNLRKSQEVVLGVHIYFPRALARYDNYYTMMEDFVSEYNGPLVILEGLDSFNGTVEAVSNLGRLDQTFFVKTFEANDEMDPKPIEIGWRGLVSFLREFDPKIINLIGGQYKNQSIHPRERGCLGLTEHELKKRSFSVNVLNNKGLTYN